MKAAGSAIGEDAFRLLLSHPRLAHMPAIMETPKKAPNDDADNMRTVLRLSGRDVRRS